MYPYRHLCFQIPYCKLLFLRSLLTGIEVLSKLRITFLHILSLPVFAFLSRSIIFKLFQTLSEVL